MRESRCRCAGVDQMDGAGFWPRSMRLQFWQTVRIPIHRARAVAFSHGQHVARPQPCSQACPPAFGPPACGEKGSLPSVSTALLLLEMMNSHFSACSWEKDHSVFDSICT